MWYMDTTGKGLGRPEPSTYVDGRACSPRKLIMEQVGGGNGHVSIAIAEKAPDLTFIVQDRPEVVAAAEQ